MRVGAFWMVTSAAAFIVSIAAPAEARSVDRHEETGFTLGIEMASLPGAVRPLVAVSGQYAFSETWDATIALGFGASIVNIADLSFSFLGAARGTVEFSEAVYLSTELAAELVLLEGEGNRLLPRGRFSLVSHLVWRLVPDLRVFAGPRVTYTNISTILTGGGGLELFPRANARGLVVINAAFGAEYVLDAVIYSAGVCSELGPMIDLDRGGRVYNLHFSGYLFVTF